ncbi:MAG: rhodanese-related sulfurtransferase [Burkholderiaceae bacterium]
MANFLTAALYKFVELPDYEQLKAPLLACCQAHQVKGTLLLANEGINGTVAGPETGVHAVLAYLRSDPRLADLIHKESFSETAPFHRMKVRLKREIVTLGVPGLNPSQLAGTYVKAQDWNQLLRDPELVLIDTRNDYEVAIGSFRDAINPGIKNFSELPAWLNQQAVLQAPAGKKPKVAMFCTGGIRCEKSTALLRSQGFDEVYHLEGGILKYLETVQAEQSLWQGECFVFDERVSVTQGLAVGSYALCRSCRNPVSVADKASAYYVEGVSCPHCHASRSEQQKSGAAERQRQVLLAQARQQTHIGGSRPDSEGY